MGIVLITGGAGSVGTELARSLAGQGSQVRVFDLPVCDFSRLEGLNGVEILKGDITDARAVREAVEGVDVVLHLAALLPPASESNRDKTFAVNVGGTHNVLRAIQEHGGRARLVFSSTVATYGDTTAGEPPVKTDHPQSVVDIYGESKIAAEQAILAGGAPWTILRISGISIPALLEPPVPWPFMADQRMEFVNRADVVTALLHAVQREEASNQVFNIAGGQSWRMLGREHVEQIYALLDIPAEEAHYRETPGWCDWYDTGASQAVLDYQHTTFAQFLELLDQAILEALEA